MMNGGLATLLVALSVALGAAARWAAAGLHFDCAAGEGLFVAQCVADRSVQVALSSGLGGMSVLLAAGAVGSMNRLAGAACLVLGLAGWGSALGPEAADVINAILHGKLI